MSIKVILLKDDQVLELAKHDSMLDHILKSVVAVPADAELEMTIYFDNTEGLLTTNSDLEVNGVLAAVGGFGGMIFSEHPKLPTLIKACDGKMDEQGFVPSPFIFDACWSSTAPEAPAYRRAVLGTTEEQDAALAAVANPVERLAAARQMEGLQAVWSANLKAALDMEAQL